MSSICRFPVAFAFAIGISFPICRRKLSELLNPRPLLPLCHIFPVSVEIYCYFGDISSALSRNCRKKYRKIARVKRNCESINVKYYLFLLPRLYQSRAWATSEARIITRKPWVFARSNLLSSKKKFLKKTCAANLRDIEDGGATNMKVKRMAEKKNIPVRPPSLPFSQFLSRSRDPGWPSSAFGSQLS